MPLGCLQGGEQSPRLDGHCDWQPPGFATWPEDDLTGSGSRVAAAGSGCRRAECVQRKDYVGGRWTSCWGVVREPCAIALVLTSRFNVPLQEAVHRGSSSNPFCVFGFWGLVRVEAHIKHNSTLETTLGQMAPPQSGNPLRMPPDSGGIPGQIWKVPFALMLSPGWGKHSEERVLVERELLLRTNPKRLFQSSNLVQN